MGNLKKGIIRLLLLFYEIIPYFGFIVNKNKVSDSIFPSFL